MPPPLASRGLAGNCWWQMREKASEMNVIISISLFLHYAVVMTSAMPLVPVIGLLFTIGGAGVCEEEGGAC